MNVAPSFSNVIDAIWREGRLTSAAPAVCHRSTVVTYAELLSRAAALGRALRELGVGPGTLVACHLDRSPELIVGILGVLASGAAYVPLDPEHPPARRLATVTDSGASVLLSDSSGEFLAAGGVTRLDPSDWPDDACAEVPQRQNGLAYVVYTSGSTGSPKGVCISDGSLANYVKWACANLTFDGGGVPLAGSIGYDHVVTSLFPPLVAGECLHLFPNADSPRAVAEYFLTGRRYSYIKLTPSRARMLSAEGRARLGKAASLIIFGGERLPSWLVRQVRRDAPSLRVINHYGPTEATVGCCTFAVPPSFDGCVIPIGFPLPGCDASVRDDAGNIVAPGTVGELYLAGACLADGYWNEGAPNRALTQRAFVELPDEHGIAKRWYRTGDLATCGDDGCIHYLGRIEDQVKSPSERIDPAEVERALVAHPDIENAAVVTRHDAAGPQLVAAVTPRAKLLTEVDVRRHLGSLLPTAMLPRHVLVLDELPIGRHGKLDTGRLIAAVAGSSPL